MSKELESDVKKLCEEFFNEIDMPTFEDEDSIWTKKVFEAFCKIGKRRRFNVWYKRSWNRSKNRRNIESPTGEYLVDLIWSTWEEEFYWDSEPKECYWNELVLECEWGDGHDEKENYRKIMYDFAKVIDVKGRFKVMVFGYHNKKDKEKILTDFVDTLERYKWVPPEEEYLFIAFPWKESNPKVEGYFWDRERKKPIMIKSGEIR